MVPFPYIASAIGTGMYMGGNMLYPLKACTSDSTILVHWGAPGGSLQSM